MTRDRKQNPIKPMVEVIFYSNKKPFRRRQWYWRAVHQNGNTLCDSSEGYNNSSDAMKAFHTIQFHIPFATISCPELP